MVRTIIAFGLSFILFIGCATQHKSYKATSLKPELTAISAPANTTDISVIKPRKRDTLRNLQKLIDQQYQLNFDKYFVPKFNQLSGVIERQAGSINNLSNTLVNMRARSIKTRDSLQRISNYYQQQVVELQKSNFEEAKNRSLENKAQIEQLNKITKYLIWGFFTLLIIAIIIFVIVFFISRSVKRLQKALNYE